MALKQKVLGYHKIKIIMMKKNYKYLKDLQHLKNGCSIYIYGSGSLAKSFFDALRALRDDINILGFINSFKSGQYLDIPIFKISDLSSEKNFDHIIICSDPKFWDEISCKINEYNAGCYLVNIFWDFDLYGEKRFNKVESFKHLIPKVKELLHNESGKLVFDTITNSMRDHNISKTLTFLSKKDYPKDFSKYVKLKQGDFVLNGGSCFGKESEYFSSLVGKSGMIFNFDPNNDFKNNESSSSIRKINDVLWDKSKKVSFIRDGSRSRVIETNDQSLDQINSTSIDDFVKKHSLNRLDFITLDVEGAEQKVLNGAIKSIKRFRPYLAISIYHSLEDFFEIPLLINQMVDNYFFHIELYDPYCIDTTFFGIPSERI